MATSKPNRRPLALFALASLAVHAGLLMNIVAFGPPVIDSSGSARQIAMHLSLLQPSPSTPHRTRIVHVPQTAAEHAGHRVKAAASVAPAPAVKKTTTLTADTFPALQPTVQQDATPAASDDNYRQPVRDQLHDWLTRAIASHFTYPAIARRHHWQGRVRIALRIEADGRVSHIDLVNSSGHAVLDRAALDSLARVARIPDATGWLHGHYYDMVIPIEYRLLDS